MRLRGIIIFPTLFTPKIAKGATDAKFSGTLLFPPNDPQVAVITQHVNTEKANAYPSGFPVGTDCCWGLYDDKYKGKDYYNPQFAGWWALSGSARADDRPHVVTGTPEAGFSVIEDPSKVYSGCVVDANFGITAYTKGRGGIGGWLNGILFNGEEGQFGRMDGKSSAEAMFGGPGASPVAPVAHVAPVAPVAHVAPVAPVHQMTEKAGGATYESHIAGGWTDEMLIAQGMMLPPGGVSTVF
jgi:hypothetical protein